MSVSPKKYNRAHSSAPISQGGETDCSTSAMLPTSLSNTTNPTSTASVSSTTRMRFHACFFILHQYTIAACRFSIRARKPPRARAQETAAPAARAALPVKKVFSALTKTLHFLENIL